MPRTCRFVEQAKQVGYSLVSEFPHPGLLPSLCSRLILSSLTSRRLRGWGHWGSEEKAPWNPLCRQLR